MSTLALPRRRASLWGIAAMLAAVLTGLLVYSYLSYIRSQIPRTGKLVPLVVAAHDLEPGTTLDQGAIRITDHPDKYLPVGALSSQSRVLGRVLALPVFEGEPITVRKLGAKGGQSSIVPAGMRAYSLAAGSGLAVVPKPGDRVDVIVTLPREVLGTPTTVVALRSKEVASVGTTSKTTLGSVGEQLGLEEKDRSGLAITLFVTPAEAQQLAMAESLGRITIVLAPSKPEDAATGPVRPEHLGAR